MIDDSHFARRVAIVISVVGLFAIFVYTANLLLLAFAGVLGAVITDAFAEWICRRTNIGRRISYLIVLIGAIGLVILASWFLVPRVVVQLSQLTQVLPKALKNTESYLNQYEWGRIVTSHLASHLESIKFSTIANEVAKVGRVLAGIVIAITITVVLTAYLGEDPAFYKQGFLAFLPNEWRPKAKVLFEDLTETLRRWLMGQAFTMSILGVATLIGLLVLGVPLAFTLSLFTGIMIFIPFAGAVIAYVAVALVTLSFNPSKLLVVTVLYVVIHILEGYVLTPLVQKRAVYLPPVLTIMAEVLMSALFGFLGLVLATPLAAALRVVVERLYLEAEPRPLPHS